MQLTKKLIHSKQFTIRWGDMDAYQHLNNTAYFLYAQEARFAMMCDLDIPPDLNGVAPVLASTSCQFIMQIRYPQDIIVDTYLAYSAGKKNVFEHIIRDEQTIFANLEAVIIWYDFAARKSVAIPNHALDVFTRIGHGQ